jgi:hypothetical protein
MARRRRIGKPVAVHWTQLRPELHGLQSAAHDLLGPVTRPNLSHLFERSVRFGAFDALDVLVGRTRITIVYSTMTGSIDIMPLELWDGWRYWAI